MPIYLLCFPFCFRARAPARRALAEARPMRARRTLLVVPLRARRPGPVLKPGLEDLVALPPMDMRARGFPAAGADDVAFTERGRIFRFGSPSAHAACAITL